MFSGWSSARSSDGDSGARQILTMLRARAIVFATGAIERPLVFSNNDRPGVMLASAARTYLNRFAVLPGRKVVVATTNDGAYRTAFDLAAAGAEVTVADMRAERLLPHLSPKPRASGITVRAGHTHRRSAAAATRSRPPSSPGRAAMPRSPAISSACPAAGRRPCT